MRFPVLRAALVAVLATGLALPAVAQERPQRKSILELLFGSPKRKAVESEPAVRRTAPVKRKKKRPQASAAVAKPVVVEKQPDAHKVLVVGDFIAGGLGDGLAEAFEATPGIAVERRTNGSSGLVRDDYYDWPAALPALISETDPAVVVVSLGANDRQQMALAGGKEKFRSENWMKDYEARVARLVALARTGGRPLLWVGMPAFQSSAMTADMTTLNTVYRANVEKAGGEFIDIWDGFVDEQGRFVTSGSDINGQQVRLRGSDGINFTKAGKRKLAFYVEKDIRRLLGEAAVGAGARQADLKDLVVAVPAEDAEITQTPPIALTDPALDGSTALLGGAAFGKGNGKSPREKLIDNGEVADAPQGRVDDFRLPTAQ